MRLLRHLVPLLAKPELSGYDIAPESFCLGVRLLREWRNCHMMENRRWNEYFPCRSALGLAVHE